MRLASLSGLAIALALTANAQAAPDDGPPAQWVCQGGAMGYGGEQVQADLYVEADGKVVGRSASWNPPRLWNGPVAAGLTLPSPDLTVIYAQPDAKGPGPQMDILVSASGDARRLRFRGMRALLVMDDGGGSWQASMEPFPAMELPDRSSMGFASGLFGQEAAASGQRGTAVVSLFGGKGVTLAAARFDLSPTAGRDALYAKALAEAEEQAKTPTACLETRSAEDAPD